MVDVCFSITEKLVISQPRIQL